MNSDILKGQWTQLKGQMRKQWGKLTDDEVDQIQGNAESASALIPLLERSPLFENVGFNAPSNRGRDNRETFSLKAELEKPKPAAKGVEIKETKSQSVKESKAKP